MLLDNAGDDPVDKGTESIIQTTGATATIDDEDDDDATVVVLDTETQARQHCALPSCQV